jgi:cyclophilin family peptidyl-prolyl cis-trans isomerase
MIELQMPRKTLFTLVAVASISITACGDSAKNDSGTNTAGICNKVPAAQPQPKLQKLSAPTQRLPDGSVWKLDFKTNCGSFTIEVDAGVSPKTASSIVSLAKSGFYDGLAIHRIAPGFVIQGGDPAADGTGGPGYRTVERPNSATQYIRGTVAMAKSGAEPPGSAGSQFFIVTGDDAQLPPEYAVLGKVVAGISTADLISSQPIDQSKAMGGGQDGPPAAPVVIESVKVTRAG